MDYITIAMVAINIYGDLNGSHDYDHLPPLYVCVAGTEASEKDWREIDQVECYIASHSVWRADEVRVIKMHAYQVWDVWWLAANLRRAGRHEWTEQYEEKLIMLIGEENFRLGNLPLPISWR